MDPILYFQYIIQHPHQCLSCFKKLSWNNSQELCPYILVTITFFDNLKNFTWWWCDLFCMIVLHLADSFTFKRHAQVLSRIHMIICCVFRIHCFKMLIMTFSEVFLLLLSDAIKKSSSGQGGWTASLQITVVTSIKFVAIIFLDLTKHFCISTNTYSVTGYL